MHSVRDFREGGGAEGIRTCAFISLIIKPLTLGSFPYGNKFVTLGSCDKGSESILNFKAFIEKINGKAVIRKRIA